MYLAVITRVVGLLERNVCVAVEADWVYLIGSILDTPFFSVFLVVRRFIEICKIPRGDTNEDCWKYYGVAPYKNNRDALSWVLIWP